MMHMHEIIVVHIFSARLCPRLPPPRRVKGGEEALPRQFTFMHISHMTLVKHNGGRPAQMLFSTFGGHIPTPNHAQYHWTTHPRSGDMPVRLLSHSSRFPPYMLIITAVYIQSMLWWLCGMC